MLAKTQYAWQFKPRGGIQLGAQYMQQPPFPQQRVYLSHMSTNYRRDLIWRPLIRLFRRWLKKEALSIEAYERVRESEISA